MRTFKVCLLSALLGACAPVETALEVLDILSTPTDRQICESKQVGGIWVNGECYTKSTQVDDLCDGVVIDDLCME